MDITYISGLILVVLAIIANSYWQDGVRWENERRRALKAKKIKHVEFAKKCKKNAILLFRFSVFLGLCAILPILLSLTNYPIALTAAKYILGFAISSVTIALAYFAFTPKYLSPIGYPDDFDEIDEE
jgi:steroid 5-alpha reductase family enzyme